MGSDHTVPWAIKRQMSLRKCAARGWLESPED